MTPIHSCTPESTERPRVLYQCGSLGMFLVSLLYDRKCLRTCSHHSGHRASQTHRVQETERARKELNAYYNKISQAF